MSPISNLIQNVDMLESLPAIPKIAQKILSINLATDRGNEMLLKLVEQDPAISARIIGLANSPLFGTSRKIMAASDAAAVLGIKRIKMVALSFAMISSLTRNPPGLLNVTHLWQHSMAVALAMDALSKAMPKENRPPDEDVYLAGLLHDIGFLVLEYIDPQLSNALHTRFANPEGKQATEIEAEMLEMNHCELGALLARHWNLAESIVAVIRHHHSDDIAENSTGKILNIMANLAERLLPMFGLPESVPTNIVVAEWQALGITEDRIEEVEATMRKRAEEIVSSVQ
jgi:putative nucleotidyltransferase with HDIG domain